MTPREELIALDRDSLEQQVIDLQQKLESAQFERDQERARAETAEAKAECYRAALYEISIQDCVGVEHVGVCCIEESAIMSIAEAALKESQ